MHAVQTQRVAIAGEHVEEAAVPLQAVCGAMRLQPFRGQVIGGGAAG
jgi:hypothetical protein